jgi:hypothetical protein
MWDLLERSQGLPADRIAALRQAIALALNPLTLEIDSYVKGNPSRSDCP